MAWTSTGHPWMKDYNEASKFADEINGMISEMITESGSRLESEHHLSAVHRKITVLKTKLDSLEIFLTGLSTKRIIRMEEADRLNDLLSILRLKTNQMEADLNTSNFANRDSLLGPEIEPVNAMADYAGLDDQSIIRIQHQIMKEQDEDLDKLEEAILSTKHVALAMSEELDMHERLMYTWDNNAESRGSWLQDIQKRLTILNKRTKGACSCLYILLSMIGLLILILLVIVLIKHMHNTTQFEPHITTIWRDLNIHSLIQIERWSLKDIQKYFEKKI